MNKSYLIITIFLLFVGCTNEERQLKICLDEINDRGITKVDKIGWTLNYYIDKDKSTFYEISNKVADTLINFSFRHYKDNDKYIIEDYNKFYKNKKDNCFYSLQLKKDTLYYYKMRDLSSQLAKEFIVGKYYYQYIYNQLKLGQKRYFELHVDSLIKIRGNNLPKLPEVK